MNNDGNYGNFIIYIFKFLFCTHLVAFVFIQLYGIKSYL